MSSGQAPASLNLLSIVGPLAGVIVGATLTFLAQHLGLLRAFVVTREVSYYIRIDEHTISQQKKLPDGGLRKAVFSDDWENARFLFKLELYNGAQVQRIVRSLCVFLRDGRRVIARPGVWELQDEPAKARVLPPKGIVELTASCDMKKTEGLSPRTRLCISFQTVRGRTKEIVVQKGIVSTD